MPNPLDSISSFMESRRQKYLDEEKRAKDRQANPGRSYIEPTGGGLDTIFNRLSQKFGDAMSPPSKTGEVSQRNLDYSEGARTFLDAISPMDAKTGGINLDPGSSHAVVPFVMKAQRRVKIASKLEEIASKARPIITERPLHQSSPSIERLLTEQYGPMQGPSVPKVKITSPDPYSVNSRITGRDVDFHTTRLEYASEMLDGGNIGRYADERNTRRSGTKYKYPKPTEEPFKSLSYNNATPGEVYDAYLKEGYTPTYKQLTKDSFLKSYNSGNTRYIDIPDLFQKEYKVPTTGGVSTMRQPKIKSSLPSDVIFSLKNDELRGVPRRGYAESGYPKMLQPQNIGLMSDTKLLGMVSDDEVKTYNALKKEANWLSQGPDETNGYDAAIEKLDKFKSDLVHKYIPEKANKPNTGYEFENRTFQQNIPLNKKTAGPIYVNLDKLRERPASPQNAYYVQNILNKAKEFEQPVIGFNANDWSKTQGSVNRMKMLTRMGLETGKLGKPINSLEDVFGSLYNDLQAAKPGLMPATGHTLGPNELNWTSVGTTPGGWESIDQQPFVSKNPPVNYYHTLVDEELNKLYKLDDPIVGPAVKSATEAFKETGGSPDQLGKYIDENLHKHWPQASGQTLGPTDSLGNWDDVNLDFMVPKPTQPDISPFDEILNKLKGLWK